MPLCLLSVEGRTYMCDERNITQLRRLVTGRRRQLSSVQKLRPVLYKTPAYSTQHAQQEGCATSSAVTKQVVVANKRVVSARFWLDHRA